MSAFLSGTQRVLSDIDIAQGGKASKKHIIDLAAEQYGIGSEHLEPYGITRPTPHDKTRPVTRPVKLDYVDSLKDRRSDGKLILTTAITRLLEKLPSLHAPAQQRQWGNARTQRPTSRAWASLLNASPAPQSLCQLSLFPVTSTDKAGKQRRYPYESLMPLKNAKNLKPGLSFAILDEVLPDPLPSTGAPETL